MSNLLSYAETELDRLEMGDPDADYGGMLKSAVLEIIGVFARQGHSGFSAGAVTGMVEKLMRFEPLSPLTGDDDEWGEPFDHEGTRQNRRCAHVFRRPDGSAYDMDGRIFRDPSGDCFTGRGSFVEVTFPYVPTVEYVDVDENGEPATSP